MVGVASWDVPHILCCGSGFLSSTGWLLLSPFPLWVALLAPSSSVGLLAVVLPFSFCNLRETVIECRPNYSSPSMGLVENMNKELCGLVRCFSHLLAGEGKD